MELILISNTKLKIMLDESDMLEYRIGNDSDCAEPETRKAIRTLLEKARDEVGFNTDGFEIFVQLYTSRKGGCELFITKSSLAESRAIGSSSTAEASGSETCLAEKRMKKRDTAIKHKESEALPHVLPEAKEEMRLPTSRIGGRIAFSFEGIDELISVCNTLCHLGIIPKSRAFRCGDAWYLLLSDTGTSAFARLDKLTFILEYGRRENPDCLLTYINEHGSVLCESNAIEALAKLKA